MIIKEFDFKKAIAPLQLGGNPDLYNYIAINYTTYDNMFLKEQLNQLSKICNNLKNKGIELDIKVLIKENNIHKEKKIKYLYNYDHIKGLTFYEVKVAQKDFEEFQNNNITLFDIVATYGIGNKVV